MSFWESIALEVFKALVAGSVAALVFVVGQATQRFILEPVAELRRTIGEVGYVLVFHAQHLRNPSSAPLDKLTEAQSTCRRLAASLRSQILAIPFYEFIAGRGWLPCRQQIRLASSHLIGLSNTSHSPATGEGYDGIREDFQKIREALRLPDE